MNTARWMLFGAAIVLVAVAGYAFAVAGQALCAPPALPGEAAWVWSQRLGDALAIAAGNEEQCFTGDATGGLMLAAAPWTVLATALVAVLCILADTVGVALRRQYRRWSGGHAIVAGEPGEAETLAAAMRRGAKAFVARDRAAAAAIGWTKPFAEIAVLDRRRDAPRMMRRLGAGRARQVAAVTASDLANGELADAALAAPGRASLLVRLEQPSVRALKSDALRRTAESRQRELTVVSLSQMQAREGLAQAMPGRYLAAGQGIHVAVIGDGSMMQEVAALVARQGYGLEAGVPMLSILRTGRSDFAAGALERLAAASDAVTLRAVEADGADAADIDRNILAVMLSDAPLSAVHCCEDAGGSALVLALRVERVFLDVGLPVPPIVVHGEAPDNAGETGMVRVARAPRLAAARDRAALLDQRAVAFHESYLAGQRVARGAAFGSAPAECDWRVLPERFRDDNRNAADHIDYKLARIGCMAVRGGAGAGAALGEAEIVALAQIEHARWVAARCLAGWRLGPERDDSRRIHPDLKPYAQLGDDAKRKDREQAALIPAQLAANGEAVARPRPLAVLAAANIQPALALLERKAAADPTFGPLIAVALDGEAALTAAEAALAAGFGVEVVLSGAPQRTLAQPDLWPRAAAILRRAWRIRVSGEEAPTVAAARIFPVLVDAEGKLHEAVLA